MRRKIHWIFRSLLVVYLLLILRNWFGFDDDDDGDIVGIIYNTNTLQKKNHAWIINSDNQGNNNNNNNNINNNPLEKISSVDYWACCGLGHRLIRMSNAYYVAKEIGFSFRCFWGWCGEKTKQIEVYSYLFRPYTTTEVSFVQSHNLVLPYYNDVPGFFSLTRTGDGDGGGGGFSDGQQQQQQQQQSCPCQEDKIQSDFELYTSLRERFRQRHIVEEFVNQHFHNKFVIGIHIRAGNGETGDFVNKGRGIDDPEIWVKNVCKLIRDYQLKYLSHTQQQQQQQRESVVLYIATDTPSMIPMFRRELLVKNVNDDDNNMTTTIPVFDLPQSHRPKEGQGVLFGEAIAVTNKGNNNSLEDDYSDCLQGWTDTLTDMFLLSHADVVIAGKPSSFSQTLPMSIAFGKQATSFSNWSTSTNDIRPPVYCEVIPHYEKMQKQKQVNIDGDNRNTTTTATTTFDDEWIEVEPTMQCYSSYMEWCCNYSTWIQFRHKGPKGHMKTLSKEFIQFPKNKRRQRYFVEDVVTATTSSTAAVTASIEESFNKQFNIKAMRNRTMNCPRPKRGRAGGGRKDKCLPHKW